EQHKVPFLDAAILDRFGQSDGNSPGGRVRVFVDVEHDLLGSEPEFFGAGLDDAKIGLVGNIQREISSAEAVAFENLLRDLYHALDRQLENLPAVLMNVMHFLVDGFMTRGMGAPSRGHVEELAAPAVAPQQEIENSLFAVFDRLQQHGA